jgi:YwiC-like protein
MTDGTVSAHPAPGPTAGVSILAPKEHGAYGQLLFPIATALAIGNHNGSAAALAGACVATFVGHEAVLTLLGQRGARVARERRRAAIFSLACCAILAGSLGAWALTRMTPASRATAALPVVLAGVLVPFILSRREHSTIGEVVAAITLSSCGVPIARAGGIPPSRALTCWLVFAMSFTLATLAVRSAIARVKSARAGSRISTTAWLACATIALTLVLASRGWIPSAAPLALLPVCGLALALSLFPPHPRHLRAVGWSLVSATAVTSIVLVVVR